MIAKVTATVIALFLLLTSCPLTAAELTDGLIGYWRFDGDGGDSSTLGNDLTIYGGAGFAEGLFGQALDLHGDSSQYAAREVDDAIYDFGFSDFCVSLWVNHYNTIGGEQTLIEKFTDNQGPGWTITALSNCTAYMFWSVASLSFGHGPLDTADHEWHHFAVRRSGEQFALFFDSAIVASLSSAAAVEDTPNPLLVGKRRNSPICGVDGRVDEVAIWNRALSDAEIAYLYNGGAGNQVLPPYEPVTRRVPADYSSIQAAIDASFDGDTVLVAPGEYVITEPISINGKAVKLVSTDGADVTLITMSETPSNPTRASVVLLEGQMESTVLQGFTLSGGHGTDTGDSVYIGGSGGGILCARGASATVTSCSVIGNSTEVRGGGVSCYGQAKLMLIGCSVANNVSGAAGGGIHCIESDVDIVDCVVSGNRTVTQGGGGIVCFDCVASIRSCTVTGNQSCGRGGGVFLGGESPTEMKDCVISGNSTQNRGGGVCIDSFSPTVANCTISMNSADSGGGGVYCTDSAPTVVNCVIWANWGSFGGGVYCAYFIPSFTNCTISHNTAGSIGGVYCEETSSSPKLTNCIVWENAGGSIGGQGLPVTRYSCIQGEAAFPGEGNINIDPLFLGDAEFHLQPGSPCIDVGTSEGAPSTDIEGNTRPCGAAVDMGGHEYCPSAELALMSAHVAECAPAHVLVNLTNSYAAQAFSFGVAHDRAVATLTVIDFVDCPVIQALNGGQGPDYFGVDLAPGTANCAPEVTAGGTVYCVASQSTPSTETIPAGADQPIARFTYEALPGNAPGTASPLTIVGCLGGDLPREVVITVGGLSVVPATVGGTLTIDAPACRFVRGDANRDGRLDISDVVTLLMYMFEDGNGPLRCEDAADANDDGAVDIGDAVRILDRLFGDGGPFNPPYPSCGTDPTIDALRCWVSACE